MRSARFFLLILLCFSTTYAFADLLPFPGARRPLPPDERALERHSNRDGKSIVAGPLTGVSMASAQVKVHVRKAQDQAGGGDKTAPLVADVSADFDMLGVPAPDGGKGIDVIFPVGFDDGKPRSKASFHAEVDGKPVANLIEGSWSIDELRGVLTLWGYSWRLSSIMPGRKLRVSVRYSIALPQEAGKAQFSYFLRTGARWDGPIGREAVDIQADKGLRLRVLTPVGLKPARRSSDFLAWEIINAKPTEDIRLEISQEKTP